MTYEEFQEYVRAKCMYETIYTDSDGREILVIKLLDAYGMVNRVQPEQEQDRQIDQLIQERDHRDEIIDKLCDAVLGPDRYEWSSQYFFEDAVREVEERMAALEAQPEQEPVAIKHMAKWVEYLKRQSDHGQHLHIPSGMSAGTCWDLARELEQFINTTPPQRKPLTDEEIDKLPWEPHESNPMTFAEGLRYFARAIEAAHGIKE